MIGRTKAGSHNLEDCYANPQSKSHQAIIVKLRLADIKRKGLALPDCMQVIAGDPAWQLKPKDGQQLGGQGGASSPATPP